MTSKNDSKVLTTDLISHLSFYDPELSAMTGCPLEVVSILMTGLFQLLHTTQNTNLMCPFQGDGQEQDVILGMLVKSFACLPAIGAVSKQSVAEKVHQVELVDQKAYLAQSECINQFILPSMKKRKKNHFMLPNKFDEKH